MTVERFIPEDPYSPPNIPVDDMNNTPYLYQNRYYPIMPLPWYPADSGDTRDRHDLRVLPDEHLAALGWTPAIPIPDFDNQTQTCLWDESTNSYVVAPIE